MEYHAEELVTGWTLRQLDEPSFEPIENVTIPSEVHRDLYKARRIPDPFKDLNELEVQWVADADWVYERTFKVPEKLVDGQVTDFVLHGLDTFATVYLEDAEILSSDNQFKSHRLNLDFILGRRAAGAKDELRIKIVFRSARRRGLGLIEKHPEHRFIVHQTEVSRAPVRKAQYQWGWDWGPRLLTCGIWRPIVLETYTARIKVTDCDYEVGEHLRNVDIKITILTNHSFYGWVTYELRAPDGIVVSEGGVATRGNIAREPFKDTLYYPRLWWPNGHGQQCLYTLVAKIYPSADSDRVLHTSQKTIGFRRVELIKDDDDHGSSFYFRINNVDIFSGGSCWIPAHSFPTAITDEDYREWVRMASDGNQNMLRVWGGGVYEPDAFYDACDEYGIMVWQDFMFACASYPTFWNFQNSATTEAVEVVQRLRHHPSLVLWCGNNEDYQLIERYNLEYDFDDKDPESWLKTNFPARYIYEFLLPRMLKLQCPSIPYHPSSPWGNGKSTTLTVDPTVGDIHQWNIWHGDMKPYQELPNMGGRFVSEFGMEAYPHFYTLQANISDPRQLHHGSRAMDFRNKAIGHERRITSYVTENFRVPASTLEWIHITQIMQADAISWAYKHWRKDWGQEKNRKCGGVLVWQLNDCWPTISWSIVDFYRIPKPAYYAMKRALAPTAVSVSRTFKDWMKRPADELWQRDTGHVDPRDPYPTYDIWIAHSGRVQTKLKTTIYFYDITTGDEVPNSRQEHTTTAAHNSTTFVSTKTPFPTSSTSPATNVVIFVTLHNGSTLLSQDTSWPEPIKYIDFSARNENVSWSSDFRTVSVTTEKPIKGFTFTERPGLKLSDNGFDVMPGETKQVTVGGETSGEILYLYVGQGQI